MIRSIYLNVKILLFISVVLPISLSAQYGFLPIIDSTVTCSYFNPNQEFSENQGTAKLHLEIFFLVDNMPVPNISFEEMAEYLGCIIRFTDHEKTLKENVWLQCIVNCKGEAGDFQIIQCPEEISNIGCQVLQVFKEKFSEWNPGIQRGKAVDVLLGLKVSIQGGKFHVSCA